MIDASKSNMHKESTDAKSKGNVGDDAKKEAPPSP